MRHLIKTICSSIPRLGLVAEGIAALAVAVGFATQSPCVTWLWPCQGEPLSAILIAAVLASYGGGSIFIACSSDWRAATSGGAAALVIGLGGFAFTEFANAFMGKGAVLLPHAAVLGGVAVCSAFTFFSSQGTSTCPSSKAPIALRILILIFAVGVLTFGYGLLADVHDVLPWQATRSTARLVGWLCVGSAVDYALAGIRGNKSACDTLLVGTLIYDLVMLVPFLQATAIASETDRSNLSAAITITLATAVVALYFLWAGRRSGRWPIAAVEMPNVLASPRFPAFSLFRQ